MSDKIIPYEQVQSVAQAMVKSGLFADTRDEAGAIVKILAGREIGLGPFASMTGIHVIKGKPVLGANLIATLIKQDPRYDYRIVRLDDDGCEIEFYDGGKPVGRSAFTAADAKAAGLGGDNWRKFPRNMYFARAISNGAKWYAAGVFGGAPIYTPDEFDLPVDEEGDVITVHPAPVQAPAEIVRDLGYAEPEPAKPAVKAANGKPPAPEHVETPAPRVKSVATSPLQWIVDGGYADNLPNAARIANGLELGKLPRAEQEERVQVYRMWRDHGAEPAVAYEHAKAGNIPVLDVLEPDAN